MSSVVVLHAAVGATLSASPSGRRGVRFTSSSSAADGISWSRSARSGPSLSVAASSSAVPFLRVPKLLHTRRRLLSNCASGSASEGHAAGALKTASYVDFATLVSETGSDSFHCVSVHFSNEQRHALFVVILVGACDVEFAHRGGVWTLVRATQIYSGELVQHLGGLRARGIKDKRFVEELIIPALR